MDTKPLHEETRHGLKIEIYQDLAAESPESWADDDLFLVGYHRDFSVDGPKTARGGLWVRKEDAIKLSKDPTAQDAEPHEYYAELAAKYHIFGLEAYIHSGVVLALESEGPFPDRRWDVSTLGLVFVSKKEWAIEAEARTAALGLIRSWNDHLSGNVYRYDILDPDGELWDSCGGFSGDYKKNGALEEARSVIDYLTHNGTTDHKGQRLMPFMIGKLTSEGQTCD